VSPTPRDVAALDRAAWDPPCPVCGGPIAAMPTHEDVPPRPTSIYAATKLAQERLCQIIAEAHGWPLTILRYFNVYGPGQSLSNPYTGILSAFYVRARGGKAIEVFEDGLESRDFIFIDDVVAATRRALLLPAVPGPAQIVNVGSGATVSISGLAHAMRRLGGWDVPVTVTGAYRVGDVRHARADTRRREQLLGLTSVTSLDEGLRRWLRWAETRAVHDATDTAMAQMADAGLYRRAAGD
jgi:dTDP-L-rhamnose 4-epimerase